MLNFLSSTFSLSCSLIVHPYIWCICFFCFHLKSVPILGCRSDMFQVIKYNGNSMNNQTLDLCKYSRICLLISDILFHSKLSGLFQLEKIFFKITVMMYRINCGIKNIKLLFQHIELWTKCMIFFQQ